MPLPSTFFYIIPHPFWKFFPYYRCLFCIISIEHLFAFVKLTLLLYFIRKYNKRHLVISQVPIPYLENVLERINQIPIRTAGLEPGSPAISGCVLYQLSYVPTLPGPPRYAPALRVADEQSLRFSVRRCYCQNQIGLQAVTPWRPLSDGGEPLALMPLAS